jgi:hypothetical protein
MTRREAIDAAVRLVWEDCPSRHKFLAAYTKNPRAKYPEASLLWLITFVDRVGDEYHHLMANEHDRPWRTGQIVLRPRFSRAAPPMR